MFISILIFCIDIYIFIYLFPVQIQLYMQNIEIKYERTGQIKMRNRYTKSDHRATSFENEAQVTVK